MSNKIEGIEDFLKENNIKFIKIKSQKGSTEFNFSCPFCDRLGLKKKSGKFFMNAETGVGFCYRAKCGWKGGIFKFAADLKGITFAEAKSLFSVKDFGSTLAISADINPHRNSLYRQALYPIEMPECSTPVRDIEYYPKYLTERGLTEAIALLMDCRICINCKAKNIPELCFKKSKADLKRFNNKILVPISNFDSQIFQAVTFVKDIPKTENPPGSSKSYYLFGYDLLSSANAQIKKGRVFIVEGIFDAVRLWNFGEAAMAILANKLSIFQAYLLQSLSVVDEFILMLDSDVSAKDMEKNINVLENNCFNQKLSVINLKEGDPNDLRDQKQLQKLYDERSIIRSDDLKINVDL